MIGGKDSRWGMKSKDTGVFEKKAGKTVTFWVAQDTTNCYKA